MPSAGASRPPSHALVPLALAAVYVVWGSSPYALRVALDQMPPFALGATRFLVAGAVLYAVLRARGVPAPTRREWSACARLGLLFLVVGNGASAVAGAHVPSSLAAMTGATLPLFTTLARGVARGGRAARPSRLELAGLAVGAAGAVVLFARGGALACGPVALLLFVSPLAWAIGTVASARLPLPRGAMATAGQLLTGGAAMALVSAASGERVAAVPGGRALAALAFLTVFGSLVAFTAYGFLVRHAPPALATSHAYVNPLVALLLGARVGGDAVTAPLVAASALILGGVAMLTAAQLRAPAPERRSRLSIA